MSNRARRLVTLAVAVGLFALVIPQVSPAAGSGKKKLKRLARQPMKTNNQVLDGYLKAIGTGVKGTSGQWTLKFDKVEMRVVTDERADRMRVMAPIVSAKNLSKADMRKMMEANFDRALDAKYAIWNDAVWAVFVHPLGSLGKEELRSAIAQVARLRKTYGTTYVSTDMVFGG